MQLFYTMNVFEWFREIHDCRIDPVYRKQVELYKRAWDHLCQPYATFADCVTFFKFRTHDRFYGEKNKAVKQIWIDKIKHNIFTDENEKIYSFASTIGSILDIVDQVEFIGTLYERIVQKDTLDWEKGCVSHVFEQLVALHRDRDTSELFKDFFMIAGSSLLIPREDIAAYLPEYKNETQLPIDLVSNTP
jgi:hypothetical protein